MNGTNLGANRYTPRLECLEIIESYIGLRLANPDSIHDIDALAIAKAFEKAADDLYQEKYELVSQIEELLSQIEELVRKAITKAERQGRE